MKFKIDFVTNSSSASFILYIDSSANNLEEFELSWKKYINYYTDSYSYRIDEKIKKWRKSLEESWKRKIEVDKKIKEGSATKIEKTFYGLMPPPTDPVKILDEEIIKDILGLMIITPVVGNVYSIESWTSMFNNIVDDVPPWMIELIILYNMNSDKLLDFGFKSVKLKIDEDGG